MPFQHGGFGVCVCLCGWKGGGGSTQSGSRCSTEYSCTMFVCIAHVLVYCIDCNTGRPYPSVIGDSSSRPFSVQLHQPQLSTTGLTLKPCNLLAGPLVEIQELVAEEPTGGKLHAVWPMRAMSREIGENDVGVVAWQLTLKTPECPQGRQVQEYPNRNPNPNLKRRRH